MWVVAIFRPGKFRGIYHRMHKLGHYFPSKPLHKRGKYSKYRTNSHFKPKLSPVKNIFVVFCFFFLQSWFIMARLHPDFWPIWLHDFRQRVKRPQQRSKQNSMILKSQFGKPCPQKTSSCMTSLIYVKNSVYHIYSHLKSNVAWWKENYFLQRVFKEHFIELGLHGIFTNNLMSPTT